MQYRAYGLTLTSTQPVSTLQGGSGNDSLTASQGYDVLTGGAGADHFIFLKEPWAPVEITDFTPGTDLVDLRGVFAAVGYAGSDPIATATSIRVCFPSAISRR